MLPTLDRVYVNARARADLNWTPKYSFAYAIHQLAAQGDYRSPLARAVGAKGYHAHAFLDGPYPVEEASWNRPRPSAQAPQDTRT